MNAISKSLAGGLIGLTLATGYAISPLSANPAMSFFLTSVNPGKGADLGGLAGADQYCQRLAASVGAGGKTWKAYLSATASQAKTWAQNAINSDTGASLGAHDTMVSVGPGARLEQEIDGLEILIIDDASTDSTGAIADKLATRYDDVRAVIVYGGPKVFAAGADVKEMAAWSYQEMVDRSAALQAAFTSVARIPKPTIAAITGYALGGGCELALCCDLRIAGDNAKLGQPEILLGIIPGAGGTQRLPRLVGPARAKEMILRGKRVDGATAPIVYGGRSETQGEASRMHPAIERVNALAARVARLIELPLLSLRADRMFGGLAERHRSLVGNDRSQLLRQRLPLVTQHRRCAHQQPLGARVAGDADALEREDLLHDLPALVHGAEHVLLDHAFDVALGIDGGVGYGMEIFGHRDGDTEVDGIAGDAGANWTPIRRCERSRPTFYRR